MASDKGSALAKLVAIVMSAILLGLGVAGAAGGYFAAMPMPPAYKPGVGRGFCFDLAVVAQHRSSQWMWAGVLIIGMGAVCTGIGAMIGPGPAGGDSARARLLENRNAILALVGAVALAMGWGWVQRSDAATMLGAEANASLAGADDPDLYKACILSRSRWLMGRAEHTWLDNVPGARDSANPHDPAPPGSAK
jgi:hypothetical protein